MTESLSDANSAIHLASADFLLSPLGRAAAQSLATADLCEEHTLNLLTTLRRDFSPMQAGALLTLARLRQRAKNKFPWAEQMFFTPEALEQATAWPVAEHRADWFARFAPPGPLLDLGCGIGGDTLALAQHRHVIAVEQEPVRLRFAQANAAVFGLERQIEFRQADFTTGSLPTVAAAFIDPARRSAGKRIFSLHQMQPPLAALLRLQQQLPHLGVKVMPSVKDDELPVACSVEFVSHAGVCKEAVLWFGLLAQEKRYANIHSAGPHFTGWQRLVSSGLRPPLGELQAGQFLHEPDPAVIRAGALVELCQRLQAHLFDAQIAYLVSPNFELQNRAGAMPLPVQSFQLEEIHPFSLKQLNQRLLALGIGQVELKKRGFPTEPELLRNRLKLTPGGRAGVVIFTQRAGEHLMLIGKRVYPA